VGTAVCDLEAELTPIRAGDYSGPNAKSGVAKIDQYRVWTGTRAKSLLNEPPIG
jgi:hypothetical protein